jgi:threonine/homoserine/homoserine lactone efflux protein
MFGTHDLALFVISGLLLNLTPGPDTLYIVGRSTTQGWRAGVVAALGIGAGIFVHIGAAAAGLSAILAASSSAFTVVKIAGAAYLVYIGISLCGLP